MKFFKTYESFLNEGRYGKIWVASKKGSYPATIVVIKNKKVIHQEQVNTPEAIPAAFNVLQKKYPRSIITVEDKTGATLYREVDEKKAYMTKIDLEDFKAIKKGTKVLYMGAEAEVLDNNGFVLTLKQNGKKFTVNKSMFDHGGMISEGVMSNIHLMADASKDWNDFLKKFKKDYKKVFQNTPDFMDWLYDLYKDMAPGKVEEAYVPSNITSFAKDRGVLADVKQIARWAEKAGKRIYGGTAIGKGYDTLVLDLTYQGSEIYFDTYKGTIKVNRQPVTDWKSFSKAVNESSERDGTEASDGKYKHEDHLEKDIEGMWKKTYGENFSSKYPGIAKIIRQRKNIDARELARIWDETYGENFKEEYPAMWDALSK